MLDVHTMRNCSSYYLTRVLLRTPICKVIRHIDLHGDYKYFLTTLKGLGKTAARHDVRYQIP